MQGTEATELIVALEEQRIRRGLDHRGFSTLLGIHETAWHYLRTGKRPPSLDILTLISQKLPELKSTVCSYMTRRQIPENSQKNNGGNPTAGELSIPASGRGRKT